MILLLIILFYCSRYWRTRVHTRCWVHWILITIIKICRVPDMYSCTCNTNFLCTKHLYPGYCYQYRYYWLTRWVQLYSVLNLQLYGGEEFPESSDRRPRIGGSQPTLSIRQFWLSRYIPEHLVSGINNESWRNGLQFIRSYKEFTGDQGTVWFKCHHTEHGIRNRNRFRANICKAYVLVACLLPLSSLVFERVPRLLRAIRNTKLPSGGQDLRKVRTTPFLHIIETDSWCG